MLALLRTSPTTEPFKKNTLVVEGIACTATLYQVLILTEVDTSIPSPVVKITLPPDI